MSNASPIRLSWKQGFARNAAQSANPHLWKGLAGLWAPSLGPTGLILRDVSGRHNHGTLTNMDPATDWVMSERGWAIAMDGVSDYIQLERFIVLNRFAATINIWIQFNSLSRVADRILSNSQTAGESYLQMTNFDKWRMETDTPDDIVEPSPGPPDTGWHLVTFVFDNLAVLYYVDGELLDDTETISDNLTFDRIGMDSATFTHDGRVGVVSIYDRPLPSSTIQQLYADPDSMLRLRTRVPVGAAGAPPGNRRRRMILFGAGA